MYFVTDCENENKNEILFRREKLVLTSWKKIGIYTVNKNIIFFFCSMLKCYFIESVDDVYVSTSL